MITEKRALLFAMVLAIVPASAAYGQAMADLAPPNQPIGRVHDWTQHHLIFTETYSPRVAVAAQSEMRVMMWMMERSQSHSAYAARRASDAPAAFGSDFLELPRRARVGQPRNRSGAHIDWSVSLGNGNVPGNMYPAKYAFDINATPSCANDFIVYGLNTAGVTGGQANLVALNYLYSGTTPANGICNNQATPSNGTSAAVMWAYNIGAGKILTSPTLSMNGTKVAFVESGTASSVFHVLTWQSNQVNAGNGAIAKAAVPGTANGASMKSLTFDASASDTLSSPYIDYTNDVAYVGTDGGKLYKITGVFNGTPALAGSPWPVTVSSGLKLTAPVLDVVSGRIFIGDSNGALKAVNAATGAIAATLQVGASGAQGSAIVDPPIVDSSNGVVYAFSANDGTGAVAVESNTNLTQLARARVGLGDVGASAANVVNLHSGTLTDAYFTNPSTGVMVVCGTNTADTTPSLWVFGFSGTTLNTTAQISNYEFLGSAPGTECSPLTVFNNPAIGTDTLYFSVPKNCGGGGCVESYQITGLIKSVAENGGTSGIIIDNVSTSAQASSIYFTTLGATKNAVKLTQAALQ